MTRLGEKSILGEKEPILGLDWATWIESGITMGVGEEGGFKVTKISRHTRYLIKNHSSYITEQTRSFASSLQKYLISLHKYCFRSLLIPFGFIISGIPVGSIAGSFSKL